MDYTIKIGGEAGQGIQTVGDTLAKLFSRGGFYVFTSQDYESRVRGGHNSYQVRVCDKPVSAARNKVDILVAFDDATVDLHTGELTEGGTVVYDPAVSRSDRKEAHFLGVPFGELARATKGGTIVSNTVAIGAVLGMLGYPLASLLDTLKDTLKKKDEETLESNREAARMGYEYAGTHCARCAFTFPSPSQPKMLIDGNEAIGLGAVASGCKFYAAYPMTPSTGIMVAVAKRARKFSIIVEQAEDEISAINMALGASFAGVRAMTGSSGGGFALMVEGLSLAGMTETPIVIALAQRPGPATGFPTRTEQGELLFALHAGHGEFPRVIFAPGTPEQAFHLTNKAFDLAERFQIPVFILTDQYLADTQWSYESFERTGIAHKDYRLRGEALAGLKLYKRHELTKTGISALAIPGASHHLVVTDSDEHNEDGHLIEDAATRVNMVEKRYFRKMASLKDEMGGPSIYGADNPEVVIAGWGSTLGIMREAVDRMITERPVAMVHFAEIYPFPRAAGERDYLRLLEKAGRTICVEQNGTSQFARLMKTETGYEFTDRINKFDGRPFFVEELIGAINDRIK